MNLQSMTGFARAAAEHGSTSLAWEVKSVNGKSAEVRLRLPQGFERLEPAVRQVVQKRFSRGNFQATLTVGRPAGTHAQPVVNEAFLKDLAGLAKRLQEQFGTAPPSADGLLALRGVLDVLAEEGLRVASAQPAGQWLPPEGFRLTTALVERGEPADALLCFNDRLAMGAYQALQEAGVRVPDDVSVLSFDDTPFARWLRPGLTTFAFPQRALGRRATDELIDLIERAREDGDEAGGPGGAVHLIPLPLRTRESVAERG